MSKETLKRDKEEELQRKVFVGGITQKTNEDMIEAYFSKFGLIEDILINRFSKSGASKGCGFILFQSQSVAQRLIQGPQDHTIDGKNIEVRECHRKGAKKAKDFNYKQEAPLRGRDNSEKNTDSIRNARPFAQMIRNSQKVSLYHQILNLRFTQLEKDQKSRITPQKNHGW